MGHKGGARKEGGEDAAVKHPAAECYTAESHQKVLLKGTNMGHKGGALKEGGEDTAAVHQQQNAKQKNVIKWCY